MQAAVAYGRSRGDELSFAAGADRFVRLREDRTAHPNISRRAAYDRARTAYRTWLHRLYPEVAVSPDSLPLAP